MAKKEAHAQALKMFIDSKGKTSLTAIAEAVRVSANSVARWHKTENWKAKIEPVKAAPTGKRRKRVEGVVIRKRDLFDQAAKIFQESGGKISNVELGKKVKVSTVTIASWKKMPQWSQAAAVTVSPGPVEVVPPPQAAPPPEVVHPTEVAPPAPSAAVDIEAITCPQDLVALNQRLRLMLQRDFLTVAEIEHLANAKLTLLEAADVYLGIVKGTGE
jgi:uncharacterized protein YjcR